MKAKRVIKSLSLNTVEDLDIIDKLESVGNISEYIKRLIREELKNNSAFTTNQISEIKNIIQDMIKDKSIKIDNENDIEVDPELLDALDQFE